MTQVDPTRDEKKDREPVGYKEVELPNGDIEMVLFTMMRTIGKKMFNPKAYKDNILCIEGDFGDKTTEADSIKSQ